MSSAIGEKLRIRAMIYVAAEPVPFFWPMRNFIHHNPLHGFEHLPFDEAVANGEHLFHARGFLPRATYRRYLNNGQVDRCALERGVQRFVKEQPTFLPFDLSGWLLADLTQRDRPVAENLTIADAHDVHAVLTGAEPPERPEVDAKALGEQLLETLLRRRPLYEVVDGLYGTSIGTELDDQVVRACLDFFDEGQSVWEMPSRERGFFNAWLDLASRGVRLTFDELMLQGGSEVDANPEIVIAQVLHALEVPEEHWVAYFTHELARLHGWAGFIRWRSNATHYYWRRRFPGDLVDYMAVRALLALTLLRKRTRGRIPYSFRTLSELIKSRPFEVYLRNEFYGSQALPEMAHALEDVLLRRHKGRIARVFANYRPRKRQFESQRQAARLMELAGTLNLTDQLRRLSLEQLRALLDASFAFRKREGMIWLEAMEAKAMGVLLPGLSFEPPAARDKRPFAKALFCIDTRSERIRRNLESVGDYQTYGIAGFFGVPVSFMELGKGSETHLCPVLLTPKNLVVEMTSTDVQDKAPSARWKRPCTSSKSPCSHLSSRSRRSVCCSDSTWWARPCCLPATTVGADACTSASRRPTW